MPFSVCFFNFQDSFVIYQVQFLRISSHENKKALSPFIIKNIFDRKWSIKKISIYLIIDFWLYFVVLRDPKLPFYLQFHS